MGEEGRCQNRIWCLRSRRWRDRCCCRCWLWQEGGEPVKRHAWYLKKSKRFYLAKKKKKGTTIKCKTQISRRGGERCDNMVKMEQNWTSISDLNWSIRKINLDTWYKIRTLIRNSNLSFSLLHLLLYTSFLTRTWCGKLFIYIY